MYFDRKFSELETFKTLTHLSNIGDNLDLFHCIPVCMMVPSSIYFSTRKQNFINKLNQIKMSLCPFMSGLDNLNSSVACIIKASSLEVKVKLLLLGGFQTKVILNL